MTGCEMEKVEPEHTIREIVDACADCDVCRHLMDSSCLLFPELYRLIDKPSIKLGSRLIHKIKELYTAS